MFYMNWVILYTQISMDLIVSLPRSEANYNNISERK